MKRILFVYPSMMIGGSTTSLLSVLNNLDLKEYKVDLLLGQHRGELLNHIPEGINLLPPAIPSFDVIRKKKLLSKKYFLNFIKSRILSYKAKNILVSQQISAADNADLSLELDKEYDVAISFLELWPTYYVANKVKAKKKIGWIHVDYKSTGFLPELDIEHFNKFNNLIMISNTCLENFNSLFPSLKGKTMYIGNILSEKMVKDLSEQNDNFKINDKKTNIVTVCRIDFLSKALDRTIKIFDRLNKETRLEDVCWYIVGDGPDFNALKDMVEEFKLNHVVKLLGKKINPHNIVSKCDFFLLVSNYEGKPMAVTEAMMLDIPPVVTSYSSAREQIQNGYSGIIVENEEESIYLGIKNILMNPNIISNIKNNLKSENFSNNNEMKKINDLIKLY